MIGYDGYFSAMMHSVSRALIFSLLLILLDNGEKKSRFGGRILLSALGIGYINALGYIAEICWLDTVFQSFGRSGVLLGNCLMFLGVYSFCYQIKCVELIHIMLIGLTVFESAWNITGGLWTILQIHFQTLVGYLSIWHIVGTEILQTLVCFAAVSIYQHFYKRICGDRVTKPFIIMAIAFVCSVLTLEFSCLRWGKTLSELLLYYIGALTCSLVSYGAWIAGMLLIHYQQDNEEMHRFLNGRMQYYEQSYEAIQSLQIRCHDLKHQIAGIRSQSGKENLEKYLSELERSIAQYGTVIECGNEAVNVVLTEKSVRCFAEDIQFFCMADGTAFDFLSVMEIYSLFGNALDNAIEGCERVTFSPKRIISMKAGRRGDMVVLCVENFFEGNVDMVADKLPSTTKSEDEHGYGLKSIQAIAQKHGGAVDVQTEEDIFRLTVVMNPAITHDNKTS